MKYEALITDSYVSKGYQVLFFDDEIDIEEFPDWEYLIIDGIKYKGVAMSGLPNSVMVRDATDIDFIGKTAEFVKK